MQRNKVIFPVGILLLFLSLWLLYSPQAIAKNRLAGEASPYLRQHAHNPIHWYPWGNEAFEAARKHNLPIFLSVGYSTCHWCHVMEKESFQNAEIAKILNKHFIAIKVDRERRPGVDETYMLATQIITRTGGWPNSVFLTPDKKPFFAGGYFPKQQFAHLLENIAQSWKNNRSRLLAVGEKVAAQISKRSAYRKTAESLSANRFRAITYTILKKFDEFNGGFSTAPKFPDETLLLLLLQLYETLGDERALKAVTTTLDAMLAGGIHDHVGGGFHRYSIDNHWVVPHFEKMLYNQALMTKVLLRAFVLTGQTDYAFAARRTLEYVKRDLLSAKGAFFSAIDADSQEGEGTYYIWTLEQLKKALTPREFEFASQIFEISSEGNFEGANILHFKEAFKNLAKQADTSSYQLQVKLEKLLEKLQQTRQKRRSPARDEKIVPEWNGLMIEAFTEASIIFNKPEYARIAQNAARFILKKMRSNTGGLYRSWLAGKAELDATQPDYAVMISALLKIYDLTGQKPWLRQAEQLSHLMQKYFFDAKDGSFFLEKKSESFIRLKSFEDSPLPSGNALVIGGFLKLYQKTGKIKYLQAAEKLLASISGSAVQSPFSYASALMFGQQLNQNYQRGIKYAAKGNIRIIPGFNVHKRQLSIHLYFAPGWHINASKPMEDFLIPTVARVQQIKLLANSKTNAVTKVSKALDFHYPAPVLRQLSFNSQPMALYENQVKLTVPLKKKNVDAGAIVQSKLAIQACSDKICLEPEELNLRHIILP